MRRIGRRAGIGLVVFGLLLAGCGREAASRTNGSSVPLTIVEGPGGSVLALVPVYVQGKGPFTFALDTGASQSLFDQSVVEQAGLEVTGRTRDATGVTGTAELDLVRVERWSLGQIELPAATVTTLALPSPNSERGLQGLLGSDVLSRFDAFTLDYRRGVLTLHDDPDERP